MTDFDNDVFATAELKVFNGQSALVQYCSSSRRLTFPAISIFSSLSPSVEFSNVLVSPDEAAPLQQPKMDPMKAWRKAMEINGIKPAGAETLKRFGY